MIPQKHEKIRVIASTINGDRFVVAEWEKKVQVWDFNGKLISKFSSDIVLGMTSAISISEDGKLLVIAGYDNKTVTLYNVENGEIIWQRKDISRPATAIILNHSPELIYIDTENQAAFLLDKKTGATVEKPRGVAFIRESPYSSIDQFEQPSTSILINRTDKKTIKRFKHKSFAMLDACFSKDKIICSYSGNPLEAISLTNFETLWETRVVGHFLKVAYSNVLDKLLGIRWEYMKGSPKYLCYINIETGTVEKEINLGNPIEVAFLKQGSLMLTGQGKLYATMTGLQIKQFDFENE